MKAIPRRLLLAGSLALLLAAGAALAVDRASHHRLERARLEFETRVGSLDLASFARPPLADEDNAASWLLRAADLVELSDSSAARLRELANRQAASWRREEVEEVEGLLEQGAAALSRAEKALEASGSRFAIDYRSGIEAEVPDLLALLRLQRLLEVDLRHAVFTGDRDRALRDLAVVDTLGKALAKESLLVTSLVGLAIERRYLHMLHDSLPILTTTEIAMLATGLARHEPLTSYSRALRAEASNMVVASSSQIVGGTGTQGSRFAGRPTAYIRALIDRRQTAALLDTYGRLVADLGRTVPEQEAAGAPRSPFPIPHLLATIDKARATEASRRLGVAALEVYSRALEAGTYPTRYEGAVADPFAGGDLRYSIEEDGGVVLALPAAERLWQERNATAATSRPLLLWRLPPVDPV